MEYTLFRETYHSVTSRFFSNNTCWKLIFAIHFISLQIPLHRITDSASNGSVFPVVTERFSASSDHAFL